MTTVTMVQRQCANAIANRLYDRRMLGIREPMQVESDKVIFWIFNNFVDAIEKSYNSKIEMVFLLVKKDLPIPKTLEVMVDGNPKNFIVLNALAIKDARNVIKNVSEIFNSLDNWSSEYKPYSRKKEKYVYGVLKVSVTAD